MCLLGKDGTLGLLHIHHADVVLDPTWCTPEQCFLLLGPLFGSPVVKPSLKAEDRKHVSVLSTWMERDTSLGNFICHCHSKPVTQQKELFSIPQPCRAEAGSMCLVLEDKASISGTEPSSQETDKSGRNHEFMKVTACLLLRIPQGEEQPCATFWNRLGTRQVHT